MSRRVYFSIDSSSQGSIIEPAYAIQFTAETRDEAVARAIASKNGWHVCAGVKSEGSRGERSYFSATLGSPCPGGGSIPRCSIIFSIVQGGE